MQSLHVAPTSRVFGVFEAIAHQRLRPNGQKFRLPRASLRRNTAEARLAIEQPERFLKRRWAPPQRRFPAPVPADRGRQNNVR